MPEALYQHSIFTTYRVPYNDILTLKPSNPEKLWDRSVTLEYVAGSKPKKLQLDLENPASFIAALTLHAPDAKVIVSPPPTALGQSILTSQRLQAQGRNLLSILPPTKWFSLVYDHKTHTIRKLGSDQ